MSVRLAPSPLLSVVALFTLVHTTACFPKFAAPEETQVLCTNADECPTDFACAVSVARCVPTSSACLVDGELLPDGAACAFGTEAGVCVEGLCRQSICGDSVVDALRTEVCDDGAANSDTEPGACRTTCVLPACGDGVIDPGEGCDGAVGTGLFCDNCVVVCALASVNTDGDLGNGCEGSLEQAFQAESGIFGNDAFTVADGHVYVVKNDESLLQRYVLGGALVASAALPTLRTYRVEVDGANVRVDERSEGSGFAFSVASIWRAPAELDAPAAVEFTELQIEPGAWFVQSEDLLVLQGGSLHRISTDGEVETREAPVLLRNVTRDGDEIFVAGADGSIYATTLERFLAGEETLLATGVPALPLSASREPFSTTMVPLPDALLVVDADRQVIHRVARDGSGGERIALPDGFLVEGIAARDDDVFVLTYRGNDILASADVFALNEQQLLPVARAVRGSGLMVAEDSVFFRLNVDGEVARVPLDSLR